MKIVVMSDTHLSRVTDEFKEICRRYCDDADMVIHLGDHTGWAVLNYLEQYRLEAVAGNTDDLAISDQLPVKKIVRADHFRIGIIHGWGSAQDMRARLAKEFTNVDAILFGHTHQAMMAVEDGIFWFNPGSVFLGRGSVPRSLGVIYTEERIRGEIIPI